MNFFFQKLPIRSKNRPFFKWISTSSFKNQQSQREVDFSICLSMSIWLSKVVPLTSEYLPVVGFLKLRKLVDWPITYSFFNRFLWFYISEFSVSRQIFWYPYRHILEREKKYFAALGIYYLQKRDSLQEFKSEKKKINIFVLLFYYRNF